uniref:Uncharacterized protein n=1 Tax=Salix viminalis TaxID=40686 RepID=A0A6N2N7A4_SALVM
MELPTNLMKLTNLYHLNIKGTRLHQIPPQMDKLSKLQTLTDFFMGTQNGSRIKELGELKCLEGKLRIWMLQNIDDAQDALGANLEGMKDLKKLDLRWSDDAYVSTDEHLIHQLKPHVNVCCLVNVGYGGSRFPTWLINSCLVDMRLSGCHCFSLPPLGQLACLKGLQIKAFDKIERCEWIPDATKSDQDMSFPCLQVLCISECPKLKVDLRLSGHHCFSLSPLDQLACLKRLQIKAFDKVELVGCQFYGDCTSTSIPFKSPESLTFERMLQWCEWIPDAAKSDKDRSFPCIQVDLRLSGCHCFSLPPLSQMACLKRLQIKAFDKVERVGCEFNGDCTSTSIPFKSPELERCYNGVNGFLMLLKIKAFDKVERVGCEFNGDCTSTSIPFKSPESLTFERMLQWCEWIPDASKSNQDGSFPCLQMLCISECPKLKIKAFDKVERVGCEFNGDCTSTSIPFKSPESLTFERMLQWCEWIPDASKILCISECSKLKVDLRLSGCHCFSLSPLGHMACLKKLQIKAFDRVQPVGCEFYGDCTSTSIPFKSPESLTFERMLQWCEWIPDAAKSDQDRSFPCLQMTCLKRLQIKAFDKIERVGCEFNGDCTFTSIPFKSPKSLTFERMLQCECPKLKVDLRLSECHCFSLPPLGKLTCLKGLQIKAFDKIERVGCEFNGDCTFTSIPFKSPESLTFERMLQWCEWIPDASKIERFPKLKQLDISGCSYLESLCLSDGSYTSTSPLKLCVWSNLEDVSLFDYSYLKSMDCSLPSLVTLKNSCCGELESFPALGSHHIPECMSSKLKSLAIHECQKLFARLEELDLLLHNHPSSNVILHICTTKLYNASTCSIHHFRVHTHTLCKDSSWQLRFGYHVRLRLKGAVVFLAQKVRDIFISYLCPLSKNEEGEVAHKLEKIFKRLEMVESKARGLYLMEQRPSHERVPFTALLEDMKKLLLSDDAEGESLQVIPIVGRHGIDRDLLKLTKNILKELGFSDCDSMPPNRLHSKLQEILKGNKLLLVLDDFWNDVPAECTFIITPLMDGAKGSKIITTTRERSGASFALQTLQPYLLQTLQPFLLPEIGDDNCWLLFSEHAFSGASFNARLEFGKIFLSSIVRRCKGLPLTTKLCGGLLKYKKNVDEWRKLLDNNIWDLHDDRGLHVLKVSYYCLPSHLKRCFAYCAIFPKGHAFCKEEVVLLWMAEGFLLACGGNKEMKKVGYRYFEDLVSMSSFEQLSDKSPLFVMHDLTNDLAKFVYGEFVVCLDDGDSWKVYRKIRHLSYARTRSKDLNKLVGFNEVQNLCTILLISRFFLANMSDEEIGDFLRRYQRLRVLSLLHGVATNLMKLTNLYQLDIKGTRLHQMLPQMGKLSKLQTLTDFSLGRQNGSSIKELGELKCLEGKLRIWMLQNIDDAQDALGANLEGMKDLKKLDLRWSDDAYVSIDEHVIHQLKPHVNVCCLVNVGYGSSRFPTWLINSCLVDLRLSGCHCFSLQPLGQLACLKGLQIKAFDKIERVGCEFLWRLHFYKHSIQITREIDFREDATMVDLRLSGCHCFSLPPLSQMACLKRLQIKAFDKVERVGCEFNGDCTSTSIPFKSPESLTFERMLQWCEWIPKRC